MRRLWQLINWLFVWLFVPAMLLVLGLKIGDPAWYYWPLAILSSLLYLVFTLVRTRRDRRQQTS